MGEVKQSIYGRDKLNEIVEIFIRELEEGVPCWTKPYAGGGAIPIPANYYTHRPYRGINTLVLWHVMQRNGYEFPWFMSYKQALALKANVKKGEKGHQIVYWEMREKDEDADPVTGEVRTYWFTRIYTVFNVSQIQGLKLPAPEPQEPLKDRYKHADDFCKRVGGVKFITRKGCVPSFTPSTSIIEMPPLSDFNNHEEYISTKFHELGHYSQKELSLLENCKFGDHKYAWLELHAELTAAFLGSHFNIQLNKVQHTSYLNHWINALREKPQILWSASTKAQTAYDLLLKLGGEAVPFEQVLTAVNE